MTKRKTQKNEWASGGRIRCHTLKSWPVHFQAVLARKKTAEIRRMDREFVEGDFLLLSEFVPEGDPILRPGNKTNEPSISSGEFTGAWIKLRITQVMGSSQFLKDGYALLSFEFLESGQLSMGDMQQISIPLV